MKNAPLQILVGVMLFAGSTWAQRATESLSINSLALKASSDGHIEEMKIATTSGMLLYAGQLWLAAKDQNDSLLLAANMFRQGGADFIPGPISSDPNAMLKYNKVWKINRTMIDSFKQGLFAGFVPQPISDWPAHGDTLFGETRNLAPFVDVNNDGIYDPVKDGDYPCVPGDQALFFIYNDDTVHAITGADKLGVEVTGLVYAYKMADFLDSTAFAVFTVRAKQKNLTDLQIAVFNDFDIGNGTDDIVGTFVDQRTVITYNADNIDEGPIGHGKNPPSAGMVTLKGMRANLFDGIDNDQDGCIDGVRDINGNCIAEDPNQGINEYWYMPSTMYFNNTANSVTGNPSISPDFFNYMNSNWRNGDTLVLDNPSGFMNTNNGNGFINGTGTPTNYAFPGNTYDTSGSFHPDFPANWFDSPANLGDKRTVTNHGKSDLMIGQTRQIKVAYFYAHDTTTINSFDAAYDMALKIRSFKDPITPCQGAQVVRIEEVEQRVFTVYPNPTSSVVEIIAESAKREPGQINDLQGRVLMRFVLNDLGVAKLNVNNFPNGIYFIQVASRTERFLIQH